MIKLIAIDIDDTLLSSKHDLLPTTIDAIQAALAQRIKIVLCTGRPLAGVTPFLKTLGIQGDDQFAITYNGAVIESVAGHIIAKRLIDNAAYRAMTSFGRTHQIPFNIVAPDSAIYTADHDVNAFIVMQAAENSAGLFIRQPDELASDFAIAKGSFVGDATMLDQVAPMVTAAFSPQLAVIRTAPNFLEVVHPEVNKGAALQQLAEHLQLTPQEIMAVGDERNDIPMFDFAGTAIAMGNGNAIAKQHADAVTDTNDNDGLAKAIRQYALRA
ncbi:Cof-type HAD-IIB family hydrolase [Lacticaseibacillus saniviri]|uniref:Hydrolase, had superfamily, cof family n=1 Tax=Lacticaseibacillus saniviri JCM 17471 = DSM 24301 TaxID=1293598 RepID=A0A0R2MS47_9LACO|nr:Cof-type HAD-IIB family hydrolase [Lacticaseibacillus saniviri]KRO15612.1 hydrolase, had superfamily, cof family [Lacticaseibacillus saniviri JCM 17471 = DSM 24301]MCG4281178.1 Cof-type HAD-IIB family hydrolase [Lacticaseibacillus saniviri]